VDDHTIRQRLQLALRHALKGRDTSRPRRCARRARAPPGSSAKTAPARPQEPGALWCM